ncbi:MAG: glycosyltransferase family 1 protein [Geobacter sp.]|nr:MAG: glycosyltransferase family 1 protein [Geobacter sp.]
MKKKIGLFLDFDPSDGGTFQYNQIMIDAVAALPSDRFSVVLGYTSDTWQKYLAPHDLRKVFVRPGFWGRAFSLGWTRIGLPIAILRTLCPFFHPIAKALLKEKCDLWIFPSPTAKSFQIAVPSLVSIHDLMHLYEQRFPESASSSEHSDRERNYANICRWAKGVLVDSEIGCRHVQESYDMPLERIHVLPYIAPDYIHSANTPPGFDSRYCLPPKFLFYPAQFWEHKNHKRLLEAVNLLKEDIPDLRLVLAGAPQNAYDSVVRLVRESELADDVVFLGYVPDEDMPELYRRSRALVMPTFYGPTNIPPLEAFVAGCPVAISGIYGMPGQVGDAALLFNPESSAEIAECIRKLWFDDALCARLIERGKKRAEGWGRKQFNERFQSIIERTVENSGCRADW